MESLLICEQDLLNSNRRIVYCIVLLYNKKEYNLMMPDVEAETCSCWQLCKPPIANTYKFILPVPAAARSKA